ncbi:site-specific integrase [Marinospirillum perlucidum]|uniref:site-specific integrase n=1 Tax=Marinospirillum perlucidum TaxID=1982602 RepID=UPI000DF39FBC|nr:site-specific integrase [Marinospirillum perlucidum]
MFHVSSFVFDTGERYSLMVSKESGLPVYYPNLYLMTQLRNRSVSSSTLAAEAAHLVGLYSFCKRQEIDLESRLRNQECLSVQEIDHLRDFCQKNLSKNHADSTVVSISSFRKKTEGVCLGTQYARLTSIANYLKWLPLVLVTSPSDSFQANLKRMVEQVRARRPKKKNRNPKDRSINDGQIEALLEVIRPGSELNPFGSKVQARNKLIILLLLHLGIRRGELLNIRIQDVDFNSNQLAIVRRADDKDDVRVQSPNAKTQSRRLPLSDLLMKDLHGYITKDRRSVPGARKHDYLMVTHKEGPSSGMPLSISGYQKVVSDLRSQFPELSEITGHMLRHTWNRNFSEKLDAMTDSPSHEKQEQVRSFLMGWKQGSGTAATYNRRFVEQAGHKASLAMQERSGVRAPKEADHGEG